MDSIKLKPCPFCGNTDIVVEREGTHRQSCVVACGYCGARVESGETGYGSAWNTRVDLTAQRDRALEAVEKLRDKGSELRLHIDYDRWPNECDAWDEALATTEPATVELPKCDHCDAIACGTDCDGSSHYMTENFRRFEKRSGVTTDVDK